VEEPIPLRTMKKGFHYQPGALATFGEQPLSRLKENWGQGRINCHLQQGGGTRRFLLSREEKAEGTRVYKA